MRSISVATDPPYEVRIGAGLLGEVADRVGGYSRGAILTDDRVGSLYLGRLAAIGAPSLAVPPGESSKSLETLGRVLEFLAESDLDRGSCLVALGGGVVGDLGGLAASLFMRGIAVLQVPTTLLAQVDASVGGKTAVDLRAGKNLVGTLHQPAAVIADTAVLRTLPDRELRSGLGEVVKSALIDGEAALAALEERASLLLDRDEEVLEEAVARCVALKARYVAEDPEDRGRRRTLNLGHTFAHAIERAAGYGTVPHGIAVAVGIAMAARTSREIGLLRDVSLAPRVERLLQALGLPHDLASLRSEFALALAPDEILGGMRHDKKGAAGEPRLVLPRSAGSIEIGVPVAPERLAAIIDRG